MGLIALLMREEAKAVEEGRPSVSILQKYPQMNFFVGLVCFVGVDLMPCILGATVDDFNPVQVSNIYAQVRDQ